MGRKKHVAASGAKAGQWVECTAVNCRNGGLHIDSSELFLATHHYSEKIGKKFVSTTKIPLEAVLDYKMMSSNEHEQFMQRTVTKLAQENKLRSSPIPEKYYKKTEDEEISNNQKKFNLAANSEPQKYGFASINLYDYKHDETLTVNQSLKQSEIELTSMTNREIQALTYFSTENFEWVNSAIYKHAELPSVKGSQANFGTGEIETEVVVLKDTDSYTNPYVTSENEQTYEALHETVATLDKALAKASRSETRTLYRGVRGKVEGLTPKEWVKKNITVGGEITFDGYQSTSLSYQTVNKTYAADEGSLIFEIRTPEGVNISSVSSYADEQEIVLPRGSRYKVVGQHNVMRSHGNSAVVVQLVALNSKGELLNGFNHETAPALEVTKQRKNWLKNLLG